MLSVWEQGGRLFAPYYPGLLGALIILVVGWVVALLIASAVRKGISRTKLGARLSGWLYGPSKPQPAEAERWIAKAVFYLVMLFVLVAFFQALGLTIATNPLGIFLTQVFGYASRLLGAIVLLLIAWILASALRFAVVRLSSASRIDERLGGLFATRVQEGHFSLAQTLGEVVYWLVFLLFLPAVLGALGLEGILGPVQAMINKLLNSLPNIFAAFLILVISWLVGRILQRILTNLLVGVGFDTLPARLGVTMRAGEMRQSLSEIAGYLVLVVIMLFASIEASRLLGFELMAGIIAQFTTFVGRVILGLIILALGMFLANLAYRVVRASGTAHADLLSTTARVSILVLAGAMALRHVGVADEIINLAFGLLLGAVAVAVALAFGLGGRDAAARAVEEWRKSVKTGRTPQPPEETQR